MENLYSVARDFDFLIVLYPIHKNLDMENGLLQLDDNLQQILKENEKDIAFFNGEICVLISQKSTLDTLFNSKLLNIYIVNKHQEKSGKITHDFIFSDEFNLNLNSNTEKIIFAHLIFYNNNNSTKGRRRPKN